MLKISAQPFCWSRCVLLFSVLPFLCHFLTTQDSNFLEKQQNKGILLLRYFTNQYNFSQLLCFGSTANMIFFFFCDKLIVMFTENKVHVFWFEWIEKNIQRLLFLCLTPVWFLNHENGSKAVGPRQISLEFLWSHILIRSRRMHLC